MTTPLRFGDLYQEGSEALKPLPEGTYDAKAQDALATKSQNDKPMIKVKLAVKKIGGGIKIVNTQLTLSTENATALGIFFKHMEAFGLGASFFSNDITLEDVARAITGRDVRVVLSIGEWNGAPRNNVDNFLPPLGGLVTGPVAAPAGPLGGGPAPVSGPGPAATAPTPAAGSPASGPMAF